MNLTPLPAKVHESAAAIANAEYETLVGWRAITEEHEPGHTRPVRYQVVTAGIDRGAIGGSIYEIDLDGICQRASVLRRFPGEG